MAHLLHVSDEVFQALEQLAVKSGQAPEAALAALILNAKQQQFLSFEEFFQDLGMSDSEIQQAKTSAKADDANV